MPSAVQRPLNQFVPTSLDAEQQVFDEHHVLLQAGKAKLRAGFLQSQDLLPVGVHLVHKDLDTQEKIGDKSLLLLLPCIFYSQTLLRGTLNQKCQKVHFIFQLLKVWKRKRSRTCVHYLVLVDLEKHSVQHEARWLGHVQGLFSLGQPVDGVLQRCLETCCQGNGLIQLCLSGLMNM